MPATLHTPPMSGANAISGITLAGASCAGASLTEMATWLGGAAVTFATINVVGGYMVTDRMLGMFKSKRVNIMSIELGANLAYILASALFIFGLKMLGSPATARRGNLFSATGMLIAIVAALTDQNIVGFEVIIGGIILGIIGASAARLVAMTSMPEMVALFNGSGGASSLLVGWATLYLGTEGISTFTASTVALAILIGGDANGSLIAYASSASESTARLGHLPARVFNALLLAAIVASGVLFAMDPASDSQFLYWLIGLALVLGAMAVIPIGGADMPVVISLLNSYSGLAACAAGFAVQNNVLIVAGSPSEHRASS